MIDKSNSVKHNLAGRQAGRQAGVLSANQAEWNR